MEFVDTGKYASISDLSQKIDLSTAMLYRAIDELKDMDLMLRVSKVERIGSGIRRIKDAMKEYGLEVQFESTSFFKVLFKRRSLEKTVEKLPRNYPETTQKIIDAIHSNPFITRKELSQITGLTEDGVKYNLAKLKKDNILKRIGGDKGGHWEI